MLVRPISVLLLSALLCLVNVANAKDIEVVFINPGFKTNNATGDFWLNVSHFAQAAAKNLDVRLTVKYAQRNHIAMLDIAKIVGKARPDAVIVVNEKKAGLKMVKEIAKYNVPVFLLLNPLSATELAKLTQKERSLVMGSIEPDNFLVGYKLMHSLVVIQANKLNSKLNEQSTTNNKKMNAIALLGDYATKASIDRKHGMDKALQELKHVQLLDASSGNWSEEEAFNKLNGLSKRSNIDIVWAANDPMAFGAKRALIKNNKHQTTSVGGINWDSNRNDAAIDISYGGHVVLGGFAVVMVHDILQDRVVSTTRKLDIFVSNKESYTSNFQSLISNKQFDQIDFSNFSNVNSQPKPFSVRAIIESTTKTP
jgi:ABC-type sugar transport system substrate-binding protein